MSSEAEPTLDLSLEEIQAVDTILYGALQALDQLDEEDRADLELAKKVALVRSARRKLASAAPRGLCRHCKDREKRGNSPYCKRCQDYDRKYGKLPTEETLRKSARRRP